MQTSRANGQQARATIPGARHPTFGAENSILTPCLRKNFWNYEAREQVQHLCNPAELVQNRAENTDHMPAVWNLRPHLCHEKRQKKQSGYLGGQFLSVPDDHKDKHANWHLVVEKGATVGLGIELHH
jgi:hypothetical protein